MVSKKPVLAGEPLTFERTTENQVSWESENAAAFGRNCSPRIRRISNFPQEDFGTMTPESVLEGMIFRVAVICRRTFGHSSTLRDYTRAKQSRATDWGALGAQRKELLVTKAAPLPK